MACLVPLVVIDFLLSLVVVGAVRAGRGDLRRRIVCWFLLHHDAIDTAYRRQDWDRWLLLLLLLNMQLLHLLTRVFRFYRLLIWHDILFWSIMSILSSLNLWRFIIFWLELVLKFVILVDTSIILVQRTRSLCPLYCKVWFNILLTFCSRHLRLLAVWFELFQLLISRRSGWRNFTNWYFLWADLLLLVALDQAIFRWTDIRWEILHLYLRAIKVHVFFFVLFLAKVGRIYLAVSLLRLRRRKVNFFIWATVLLQNESIALSLVFANQASHGVIKILILFCHLFFAIIFFYDIIIIFFYIGHIRVKLKLCLRLVRFLIVNLLLDLTEE